MPPPKKKKKKKTKTKKNSTQPRPNSFPASPPPMSGLQSPIDPPETLLPHPSSPQENPQSQSPATKSDKGEEVSEDPAAADTEEDEPQLTMSPAAARPTDVAAVDLPAAPPRPSPLPRKPPAKRKKALSSKQRAAAKQKLALLTAGFRPVPFPSDHAGADVDLAVHEPLFRALALWDFAHLPLDRDVRTDLLIPLIAYYDPPNRRSFVQDLRITVSRADLARALMLPVKKDKTGFSESGAADPNPEMYSREESAAAVLGFMSGFMLFPFQDDACILPAEVMAAHLLVKEGQPHKVDWAGLMWMLVEKELLEAPKSAVCHYASHLQCLMKHQQPRLFQEAECKLEPVPEPVPEAENLEDAAIAEEEDDAEDVTEDDAARIRSSDDVVDVAGEKHEPGLTLGLGGDLDMTNDFEQFKEGEEQWLREEDNGGTEQCLRRCNSAGVRSMEFENLCKEDGEGRGEEGYIDDLSARYASLDRLTSFDRLTSTDLLQVMDNVNISYGQPMNPLLSSGEFLTMSTDAHKNIHLDPSHGRPYFVGNNGKRQISEVDDEDDNDDDPQRFSQNNQQKRFRSGGIWESTSSELDAILEQVELDVGKARMVYAEKEQARMNAQLQLQCMNEMLQQKDRVIQSLEKTRVEEQQKWHLEACRYEHEINVMANLVIGYKKALREIRGAFAEYRKKYPRGDEPLYHVVVGSGGLVLSAKELERQRFEKEEEIRRTAMEMINGFEKEWMLKLEHYDSSVVILFGRMVELKEKMELLKGRLAKSVTSDA
ncbi:unnamed protein product [Musa hybrid cultivar]